MKRVHYNDFPELVGQDLGASDWVEITQEKVNEFAEATGDFQWIHVDVERATKELGSPIAHGFLTLSLCSQLMMTILEFDGIKNALNYGCNKVRFTNFAPVGCRLRMKMKLLSAEPKAGGMQIINQCEVEIENVDKPACVAEIITLLQPA